jgi:hypothetical protein
LKEYKSQRRPRQIATTTIEGKRKGRSTRRRWRNEAEEGLNIMEIKNRQETIRGRREWRNIAFDGNVHNGM